MNLGTYAQAADKSIAQSRITALLEMQFGTAEAAISD
jgi:hypothetical protein